VERQSLVAENEHQSLAIGVERVFCIVEARIVTVGVSHSPYISKRAQSLRRSDIQRDVLSRFFDERIDLVRNERLAGKPHADIAADLTDPNVFPMKRDWRKPQPKVVAFVNRAARLLQRNVLRPACGPTAMRQVIE